MTKLLASLIAVLLTWIPITAVAADSSNCTSNAGPTLQILGSGGPIADDGRASSGYLLWVDDEAKVMIDAGGGTFLRFGEAGAKFESLDFVGLSHFHTDHSADFPALLKSGSFSNRERDLIVAGPDGSGSFPGMMDYLQRTLDDKDGAYGYLAGYLDGSGGLPAITALEISASTHEIFSVFGDEQSALHIEAMHVPHGIVPALAFRVRAGEFKIVFASDQNGSDDRFVEFAKGANVLVMHMVVPEGISGTGRRLHAPPSIIGAVAQRANVDTLVLSHFMARSLQDIEQNISIVKSLFGGRIVVANDLDCVLVKQSRKK